MNAQTKSCENKASAQLIFGHTIHGFVGCDISHKWPLSLIILSTCRLLLLFMEMHH